MAELLNLATARDIKTRLNQELYQFVIDNFKLDFLILLKLDWENINFDIFSELLYEKLLSKSQYKLAVDLCRKMIYNRTGFENIWIQHLDKVYEKQYYLLCLRRDLCWKIELCRNIVSLYHYYKSIWLTVVGWKKWLDRFDLYSKSSHIDMIHSWSFHNAFDICLFSIMFFESIWENSFVKDWTKLRDNTNSFIDLFDRWVPFVKRWVSTDVFFRQLSK